MPAQGKDNRAIIHIVCAGDVHDADTHVQWGLACVYLTGFVGKEHLVEDLRGLVLNGVHLHQVWWVATGTSTAGQCDRIACVLIINCVHRIP